ncbi:hypothetical protein G1H11_14200 [Phytoactinopolyspora alkaliphila]|uniref:Uncharacterized protein n=1 Tax=Phytoactinopolyspora alkaliphila TaxID=1783498 RepID=A0A6N9YNP4_9ACTN|nr:hypothetical protein [Phytoactinopolyspora alkaliphila]NED96458.1 hypothetical protein [Phytoactinopolyspora alkaliphila]
MDLTDATQQAVIDAYNAVPADIRIADALTMPWGGERNLALRKALGIPLESDEICMVNHGDVAQVVVFTRRRGRQITAALQAGMPDGWLAYLTRRADGAWLVTAHP